MYVALEGIDTTGKTTQIDLLRNHFKDALFTKEPGGTSIGGKIRDILLSKEKKGDLCEFFLFLADRAQLFYENMQNPHSLIISDRSVISGIAYSLSLQICAKQKQRLIEKLNMLAINFTLPDRIIILTISEHELEKRLKSKIKDGIESRGPKYLMKIQKKILQTTKKLIKDDKRILLVDAKEHPDDISKKIIQFIQSG